MIDPTSLKPMSDRLGSGSVFPIATAVRERDRRVRRRLDLNDAPYLLFVGDITANKGVYDLLEAYRRCSPSLPAARLVFAGTNWEGERFVREIQNTPGAIYLGPLPRAEVLILTAGAEIVALPSRSEGLPYVILEAAALKRKIIAPPGIPEFETYFRDWMLSEVTAAAIVTALQMTWGRNDSAADPTSLHDPDRVAAELVRLYAQTIDDNSEALSQA